LDWYFNGKRLVAASTIKTTGNCLPLFWCTVMTLTLPSLHVLELNVEHTEKGEIAEKVPHLWLFRNRFVLLRDLVERVKEEHRAPIIVMNAPLVHVSIANHHVLDDFGEHRCFLERVHFLKRARQFFHGDCLRGEELGIKVGDGARR
jgi:hypothetical protein